MERAKMVLQSGPVECAMGWTRPEQSGQKAKRKESNRFRRPATGQTVPDRVRRKKGGAQIASKLLLIIFGAFLCHGGEQGFEGGCSLSPQQDARARGGAFKCEEPSCGGPSRRVETPPKRAEPGEEGTDSSGKAESRNTEARREIYTHPGKQG